MRPQLESNGPKVDIFMSHDWPRAIEKHGDTQALLREMPAFERSVSLYSIATLQSS